jgi:hypothetical protein
MRAALIANAEDEWAIIDHELTAIHYNYAGGKLTRNRKPWEDTVPVCSCELVRLAVLCGRTLSENRENSVLLSLHRVIARHYSGRKVDHRKFRHDFRNARRTRHK